MGFTPPYKEALLHESHAKKCKLLKTTDDSDEKNAVKKNPTIYFPILVVLTLNMGKRHQIKTFFLYGS